MRLGVFGGSFDPPHVGHLWLAALAADAMNLDSVLFMPAAQPPHKGGRLISKSAERLLMTRLAINANPSFELTGLEMERAGPSYTIDSVTELVNPDLSITGMLATMYDARTVHAKGVFARLVDVFGDTVFQTVIARTVRFPETTVAGEPITSWAPQSQGANAYRNLAKEVIAAG